ncbi:hypothetical protein R3I94_022470 [Phoxinus phoxinus]
MSCSDAEGHEGSDAVVSPAFLMSAASVLLKCCECAVQCVCVCVCECVVFVSCSWSHSEALSVSAAALFSADLWRLSRTALPAQLLLSTGGAGELDTGRVRGHRGGSDQRREPAGWPLQPQ